MVLRMIKEYFKKNKWLLLSSFLLAVVFCYPYLLYDFLGIEMDTFFHLSRITGMAEALSRGVFLPCIYSFKNNGFGYASPLFYNDFFLILPAWLYNKGMSLAGAYKLVIFCTTFFTAYSMASLIQRMFHKQSVSLLVSAIYVFCSYRMTDVYVRGALGEVMAMTFLPCVLSGLYEVLEENHLASGKILLIIGLAGLILSHNLTFLFGVALVILYSLIYLKVLNKDKLLALFFSAVSAFLVTAWFTLPMIEQLKSQDFYVDYYAKSSDLAGNAMTLKQYFQIPIAFGVGGYGMPEGSTMNLNPGIFLAFLPLLYFFCDKTERKTHRFVLASLILGYVFLLLPIEYVPWDLFTKLRVIQFPWRLMTLATVLLTIPAGYGIASAMKKESIKRILLACVVAFSVWQLTPATQRTFGITSQSRYSDITDGTLIDPWYSASYMRVELAGGDYLPITSPDYRTYSTNIKDVYENDTDLPDARSGGTFSFKVDEAHAGQSLILPITYYKGYQVYAMDHGVRTPVSTYESSHGLVQTEINSAGTYICEYAGTSVQAFSRVLSAVSLIGLLAYAVWKLKAQ